MQCLYCETELKPFRGLFDEDFCCRDHRDKYLSSFRRALNRLPVLDISPAPTPEPLSLANLQSHERAVSVERPKTSAASSSLSSVEATSAVAAITAEQPAHTILGNRVPESAPADPLVADFLRLAVAPIALAQSTRGAGLGLMPAPYAMELPRGEMRWAAVVETEQRPAELLEPSLVPAAAVSVPAPATLDPWPRTRLITATASNLPEAALPAAKETHPCTLSQGLSGCNSPRSYDDPLVAAPLAVAVTSFCPAADGAARMPGAEFAKLTLGCRPLAGSPNTAPDLSLAHELHTPVFTPSRETMLGEEESRLEREEREENDELSPGNSPAPPETAPALIMNSAAVDRPIMQPTRAAEMMPPALALSSARPAAALLLSAPALPTTFEGQSNLTPELMADIPQSPAANQAAEPRMHAPFRPWFGSSVRIKNWRLRITFAKPA